MWPEARAAINVGVFCAILIGLCSMSFGLLGQLVSLDPIVYFASMAGVMIPMVMVVAGALALWASQNPGLLAERPRGVAHEAVLLPLIAGLITVSGSALLFLLALAVPLDGVFPSARLWIYPGNLDIYGYLEVAVLLAAYVALSVIGGILYDIIVPPARY